MEDLELHFKKVHLHRCGLIVRQRGWDSLAHQTQGPSVCSCFLETPQGCYGLTQEAGLSSQPRRLQPRPPAPDAGPEAFSLLLLQKTLGS